MTKRQKIDTSVDSGDLQALFDSMVGVPAEKPRLGVIAASAKDDSDDLQALFDAVAGSFEDAAPAPDDDATQAQGDAPHAATDASPVPSTGGVQTDVIFQKLGKMTRQVHDTLRELDYDRSLPQATEAISDTRGRLAWMDHMTGQAVGRVLNATDIAVPLQARVGDGAEVLCAQWDKAFANDLSVDQFKQLANETRRFLSAATDDSRATHAQLTEIIMAQDFQHLTGQMIKSVVTLAQAIETQLLEVLIETAPEGKKPIRKDDDLRNGPVIGRQGRDAVVNDQAQVDDLLDSLGF